NNMSDVANAYRGAVRRGEHGVFDVFWRLIISAAADHVLGATKLYQPGTCFIVAGTDSGGDLGNRNSVRAQPIRGNIDLVLPYVASQRRNFRDARNRLQIVLEIPVLIAAQFVEAVLPDSSFSTYWNTQPSAVASGPSSTFTSCGNRGVTLARFSSVRERAQ